MFPLCVPAGQGMRGGRGPGAPESEPALLVLCIYRGQPVPCSALPGACSTLCSVQRSGSHTQSAKQPLSFHGCPAQAFLLIVPRGQPSEAIASLCAPHPSRRSWLAQEPLLPSSLLAPEAELWPVPGHYQSRGCCCWQGTGAGKPTAVKSSQPQELSSAECWHLWARGWMAGCAAQPALLPKAAGLESCSRAGAEPGRAPRAWAPSEPSAGCLDPVLHPCQSQPLQVVGSCCFAGCRTRSTACGSQGWSSIGLALPSGRRWICLPGRARL